ncbi:unnamed protein product [Rhizophagus irregularis]|nr:unnamed protein product [Rhizophagus irregularis]
MQLTIKDRHDIVLEWIPYNQFVKIKKINENGFITGYSAIWGGGPFYKNWWSKKYTRDSNKELTLNCLCNSQYLIEFLINETKKYLTNHTNKHKDQNPDNNDYILVQNVVIWISGNEKIDNFIQKMQVETNDSGIVFEWITYNQIFNQPLRFYHF